MKAWKWMLVGLSLIAMYIPLFIWEYGWIITVSFIPLIFVLLFIPYGGTAKDAFIKFRANVKEAQLADKKDLEFLEENFDGENIEVAVGLSGGVDSATTAYLLKKSGYKVTAFFMKNWNREINKELNNLPDDNPMCQNEMDYEDAKQVAKFLDIELVYVDFVKDYWKDVFKPFLNDLEKGITPNPDILCNKNIKFKKFIEYVTYNYPNIKYIATGHYARIVHKDGKHYLAEAKDSFKDQTYFLAEIDKKYLPMLKFPLAGLNKTKVREIAEEENLPVFSKPDSMGICFIGDRKFDRFIENYIKPVEGDTILLETGKVIGKHKGIMFYTIGQRKGLGLHGNVDAYYVAKKDVQNNILYVCKENNPILYAKEINSHNFNWLVDKMPEIGELIEVKTRHTPHKTRAKVLSVDNNHIKVEILDKIKAVTPGQELVCYKNGIVLGGGQIT